MEKEEIKDALINLFREGQGCRLNCNDGTSVDIVPGTLSIFGGPQVTGQSPDDEPVMVLLDHIQHVEDLPIA